jgi:DNA-binding NtrC family response regulator
MRQINGLGLLQYVKNMRSSIPVVIITGKPSENSESFYLEKGAIGFFRKPLDGEALLNLIASVC